MKQASKNHLEVLGVDPGIPMVLRDLEIELVSLPVLRNPEVDLVVLAVLRNLERDRGKLLAPFQSGRCPTDLMNLQDPKVKLGKIPKFLEIVGTLSKLLDPEVETDPYPSHQNFNLT